MGRDERIYLSSDDLREENCDEAVLVCDAGGTNTRIALFAVSGPDYLPLAGLRFDSREIDSFPAAVDETLDRMRQLYDLPVRRGAASGAGPVEDGVCRLTNVDWEIDEAATLRATGLDEFHLINDFAAIGYGIAPLERSRPESFVTVKEGRKYPGTVKAVLGAGTGLGKGFLVYERSSGRFVPRPSEGGHEIFSPVDKEEFDLMTFVKRSLDVPQVIFEHLVAGSGIAMIYRFLKNDPALELKPREITESYHSDPTARRAMDMFTRFYARTAKNSALNLLPHSGIYLAGGIVARIIDLMDREIFRREFTTHPKHSLLLEEFSVEAVIDYDISLYGLVDYLVNFAGDRQAERPDVTR